MTLLLVNAGLVTIATDEFMSSQEQEEFQSAVSVTIISPIQCSVCPMSMDSDVCLTVIVPPNVRAINCPCIIVLSDCLIRGSMDTRCCHQRP
jgi:hypothetical protein